MLCAACRKVRVLIQTFKLEPKIGGVSVPVVMMFVGNMVLIVLAALGTQLYFLWVFHIHKIDAG